MTDSYLTRSRRRAAMLAVVIWLGGTLGCDTTPATSGTAKPDGPASSASASATSIAALPTATSRTAAIVSVAPRSSTALPASSSDLPRPPQDHQPTTASKPAWAAARVHFSGASDALALTTNQRGMLITLRGKPTLTKLSPNKAVVDVAISSSGKQLAMWVADGSVEIVRSDGSPVQTLPASAVPDDGAYTQLRWSGDDGWLAGSDGSSVYVWNVNEGKLRHSFAASAFSLGFGYDGHRLAAATTHQIWVWDAHTGRLLDERYTRTGGTFPTVVSADANWAASAEQDGHGATLYQTRPFQLMSVLVSDTTCDAHISVRFSNDSRTVFAHGGAKWIRAFRTKTAAPVAAWTAPEGIAYGEMADTAKLVMGYTEKGDALVFDLTQNKQTHSFKGLSDGNWALSADGRVVVSYRPDMARLWSTGDGAQLLDVTLDN